MRKIEGRTEKKGKNFRNRSTRKRGKIGGKIATEIIRIIGRVTTREKGGTAAGKWAWDAQQKDKYFRRLSYYNATEKRRVRREEVRCNSLEKREIPTTRSLLDSYRRKERCEGREGC